MKRCSEIGTGWYNEIWTIRYRDIGTGPYQTGWVIPVWYGPLPQAKESRVTDHALDHVIDHVLRLT